MRKMSDSGAVREDLPVVGRTRAVPATLSGSLVGPTARGGGGRLSIPTAGGSSGSLSAPATSGGLRGRVAKASVLGGRGIAALTLEVP